MTTKKSKDQFLNIVQGKFKDNLILKNIYSFQIKDRMVKVIFSDKPNAHTLEDTLVKIATRRVNQKDCI